MQTNSNSTLTQTQQIVAQVVSANEGITVESLHALIEATNPLKGCKLISIKNYTSDTTENTELANHVINIGFIYDNMKKTDKQLLAAVDVATIDVNKYNYSNINFDGRTETEYKALVQASLAEALTALTASNESEGTTRENNDFYLNKCLVYNTNTKSLSIIGQSVSKSTVVEGDVKVTKKKALTVAKDLIKKAAGLRTDTYRRFKLVNMSSVKVSGETVEIA